MVFVGRETEDRLKFSGSCRSNMGTKGFFIRLLPFLATFTLGIFIASFFVSVAPRLGDSSRGFGHKYHKMKRLRAENERLRNENFQLRNELETLKGTWHSPGHSGDFRLNDDIFSKVPPVPVAPAAPRLAK